MPLRSTTYLQRLHALSEDNSPSERVQDTCCFALALVWSRSNPTVYTGGTAWEPGHTRPTGGGTQNVKSVLRRWRLSKYHNYNAYFGARAPSGPTLTVVETSGGSLTDYLGSHIIGFLQR